MKTYDESLHTNASGLFMITRLAATVAQLQENIRISRLAPLNETDLKTIEAIVFPSLPENCVSPAFWKDYKKEHNLV